MSTFRSALVALALVALTTLTGCAEGGMDETSKAYCESVFFTSPSCISEAPSPAGTTLVVPTGLIRPKFDNDPTRDFVAQLELVSLSPSPGVLQSGRFRFSPSLRFRLDELPPRSHGGVNYWIYPSNDGMTKSSPDFGNGYLTSPNSDQIFGTDGMFMMMDTPFKYILVEMRIYLNGQGEFWSRHAFEVGYAR